MKFPSGAGGAASFDSFFSGQRFAFLLAVLLCVSFAPVILGFQSFVFRDFGLFGHPLAYYHRESFWRGEIPLWNPLNNCGLPFLAQWNTMVLYPPSLIYLLLPLPWSLCLFGLFHLYFGGMGMFFLAQRWTGSNFAAAFAGVVFTFNGLSLHCLMWPNNSAALSWAPWIWLLVGRGCVRGGWSLLPATIAGVCQFMAGAPEAFLLTWVGAAVICLFHGISRPSGFWKSCFRFTTIVAGVVSLAAVQLLPLLELITHSQRSAAFDPGGWAMPPWGWANLLVPLFRTVPSATGVAFQIGQAWTSSYYFGIATVWFALFALVRVRSVRVYALAFLTVVGLLLALGNDGFAWPWIKNHFGALGFMRYPIKFVFLIACPLSLLGAYGLAELMKPTTASAPWPRTAFDARNVLLAILLGSVGLIMWISWQHPLGGNDSFPTLVNGAIRVLFVLTLAVGTWFVKRISVRRVGVATVLWMLVVAADLLTHMPWQNPVTMASLLSPRLEALADLRRQAAPGHARAVPSLGAIEYFHAMPSTNATDGYAVRRLGQSHNLNILDGIAKPDGFYSLYVSRQQDVQFRLFRDETSVREAIADVMAVSHVTAPEKLFEWNARTNPLPMISAGQKPLFLPETNILNALLDPEFDPRTTILLPLSAQSHVTATRQPAARAVLENFAAQKIDFKVIASGPAVVSVSQSFYPPWKAYVDGVAAPLWRANHAFQALQVPGGEHRVQLRYEDRMFRLGAWVSGTLVLAAVICFAVFPGCRREFSIND